MIALDRGHAVNQVVADHADEEKVIPWAEGNGLWDTITKLVSDLVDVDVATFFVQNPYTCDGAEGVATRIGRQPEQVKPVLESLAEAKFLQATDLGNLRIYQLTDEPHRRQTLQQYVAWLQEGYHWTRMVMDPAHRDVSKRNQTL